MLHEKFNLFFAVGNRHHLEFCLTCNAKNILISYAYKEAWTSTALLKRNNCNVLMDSGAFTAWSMAQKKKKEGNANWQKYLIDIDKYAAFIKKYDDVIFRAVNLDVIPGETGQQPTQEQIEQAAEQGWKNYKYLKEKYGIDTIHVFHQGEPLKYLDRMLNECDYIGISPNNDYSTERKLKWLDNVFRYIANSKNSNIKTHGFGVTSKKLITRYPWFSVDSSSHSLTAGLGNISTPYGRVYISDRNMGNKNHILNKPKEIREHIEKYLLENVGATIKQLSNNEEEYFTKCPKCSADITIPLSVQSYRLRNYANIIYYMNLEKEIRKNGPTLAHIKQKTLL